MRETIYCVLLLLLLLGLGCCIEAPRGSNQLTADVGQASTDDWRRTAHGWERAKDWPGSTSLAMAPTRVHPLVVLALQVLLSLFALVAFSPAPEVTSEVSRQNFGCSCASAALPGRLVELHKPVARKKICHFCTNSSSASHYLNG